MNNKGSSSILIIMLLLVFIIIGLSMLSGALVQGKMVDKQIQWNKDFYALEGEAYLKLAEINRVFIQLKDSENWEIIEEQVDQVTVDSTSGDTQVIYEVSEGNQVGDKQLSIVLKIDHSNQLMIYQWKEWQISAEFEEAVEFEQSTFEQ